MKAPPQVVFVGNEWKFGNANLPIGGLHDANREIGVPRQGEAQTLSSMMAIPCPTPMHIDASA